MGIKTFCHPPYSPDLVPCDFWLFPIFRGCRYETIEEIRGCDEGHKHAHTRGLPWDLLEVIRTVEQVHCSRRRLLRRGLDFHECTINKSAHTKKRLETYLIILVFSYQLIQCVICGWCFSAFTSFRFVSDNWWSTLCLISNLLQAFDWKLMTWRGKSKFSFDKKYYRWPPIKNFTCVDSWKRFLDTSLEPVL